jgi:hypothetical protein
LEENQVAYKVEIDEPRKINESKKEHKIPTAPSNALREKDNERGHITGHLLQKNLKHTLLSKIFTFYTTSVNNP